MAEDKYRIFISISHRRISYWYWQSDGDDKLMPMPPAIWPAKLAFYCRPNEIIVGIDALRAAENGTKDAFPNYFSMLRQQERYYTFGGQQRPVRNLLFDYSEQLFRRFFKDVLLGMYGALSDNRAEIPLVIAFEPDIESNEKALISTLFKNSGYRRVCTVDYDDYIEKYLQNSMFNGDGCDKALVVWTEGKDLTLSLLDLKGGKTRINKQLPGLGKDPRIDYVKDLLFEKFSSANPYIDRNEAEPELDRIASDFLSRGIPMTSGSVSIGGFNYMYSLTRHEIGGYVEGSEIRRQLDIFLNENGIKDRSHVLLLLRGNVVGNSYLEENLTPGFPKIMRSDTELRHKIKRLLLYIQIPIVDGGVGPIPGPTPPGGQGVRPGTAPGCGGAHEGCRLLATGPCRSARRRHLWGRPWH